MDSLSNAFPLYLVTALCATVAYIVLSTLCERLREFLRQQQHDNSSQNYNQNILAADITLHADSITASQLEENPVITHVAHNMSENESCSVCLGDYLVGDELRVLLNCTHRFHKECIHRWLVTRSSFCPICRGQVLVRNEEHVILGDGDISLDDLEYNPQRLVQVRVEINVVPPTLINSSSNGFGV